MILSDETAAKLEKAFFDVLLSGILPPSFEGKAPCVNASDSAMYYEACMRRIKAAIGLPLFVDVNNIIRDLERVPKRTLVYDEVGCVLLRGLKYIGNKKTYCLYTLWEFRDGKLGLIFIDESRLVEYSGESLSSENVGYTYTDYHIPYEISSQEH